MVLLLLCPTSQGAALDGKEPAHLRGEPTCDCGKGEDLENQPGFSCGLSLSTKSARFAHVSLDPHLTTKALGALRPSGIPFRAL